MDRTQRDIMRGVEVPVLKDYRRICDLHHKATVDIDFLERFEFYERAKKAFAIIQTG